MKKVIVATFITLLLSSCYTKYQPDPGSTDTQGSTGVQSYDTAGK
ncbi:hypothetical protein fh0823_03480 [Francisella halioticida]|nr:lipoprotein [Francisella halioticida]BCD90209.1 hypothetical protein fh0823_03480 [Francisella halioticida]